MSHDPLRTARLTRPLIFLFALAAGAAVANLYYAQPLLAEIGATFGTSADAVGGLITATQVGYAVGVFLIVPLGDVRNRHQLIPLMMGLSAIALVATAFAPTVVALAAGLAALGLTTVAGQMLTPLTGDLADDATRGRSVGIVVSGLITGILLSRTLSGLVAGIAGWRAIFVLAAVVVGVLAVLLAVFIPRLPAPPHIPYLRLLRSIAALVARSGQLRVTLGIGSIGFAIFTMFWTALTFLLSSPPFSFSPAIIGLFGLAGLAGALGAQGAGRLFDRGHIARVLRIGLALVVIAWAVALIGQHSVVAIIVAVVLLDVGAQGTNILNQTRLFTLFPEARSRVNTAYVTGNFFGGAIGSLLATLLWPIGGWAAIGTAGLLLALAALGLTALVRIPPATA